MFQFAAFPPAWLWIRHAVAGLSPAGFPHSDTRGSLTASVSPRLFAAGCVLRRLLAPRHPPFAFFRLAFFFRLVCMSSNLHSLCLPAPSCSIAFHFLALFCIRFSRYAQQMTGNARHRLKNKCSLLRWNAHPYNQCMSMPFAMVRNIQNQITTTPTHTHTCL